jgi:hypothetical protein
MGQHAKISQGAWTPPESKTHRNYLSQFFRSCAHCWSTCSPMDCLVASKVCPLFKGNRWRGIRTTGMPRQPHGELQANRWAVKPSPLVPQRSLSPQETVCYDAGVPATLRNAATCIYIIWVPEGVHSNFEKSVLSISPAPEPARFASAHLFRRHLKIGISLASQCQGGSRSVTWGELGIGKAAKRTRLTTCSRMPPATNLSIPQP